MIRTARSLLIAGLVLAPTLALAADHLMKVDEVLLSNGGNPGSQYVELQDPGEPFPSNPYILRIYDATGTAIANQNLTIPSGTTRFLVATAQAATDFSVTAQATLTVTLPADGQACFERSSAAINCIAWGTNSSIAHPAVTGLGAAPTDGMALQLTSAGSYIVGTPTPGQPNLPPPTVDGAVDAGVTPDAPGAVAPDAGNGNGNNGGGGGCDTGGGATWIGAALILLILGRRVRG